MEFLTLYAKPGLTVLYVGAAPGNHITYLAELFPELNFVLVDPRPFECTSTSRITIIQDFFTDAMAEQYANQKVLFISDIRTANFETMEQEVVEDLVLRDNFSQMKWHKMLRPTKSLLKFRLPYNGESMLYLAGDIFLPIWGPQTTSETRLVPFDEDAVPVQGRQYDDWCPLAMYDSHKYEEQLFYFNTVTRVTYYEHHVSGASGICHCYDCRSELHILSMYLSKYEQVSAATLQTTAVGCQILACMSDIVSLRISDTRSLSIPTFDASNRSDNTTIPLDAIYKSNKINVEQQVQNHKKRKASSDAEQQPASKRIKK